jgi:hypothetical protein
MKKINFPLIFGFVFIGFVIIYMVSGFVGIFKKPIQSKNEYKCATIVYFNHAIKNLDTAYSNVVLYDDSLTSFTDPYGNKITPKDFVKESDKTDKDENDDDYITTRRILIKSGDSYELSILSDSLCLSKTAMDSIRRKEDN